MVHFSALAALAVALPLASAAFKEGCADAPWNSDVDYFETKYECSDSSGNTFCPEYHNTYVKVKNRQARFVLLHCTNEPPPANITEECLVVKAPVESVAALDGFSQDLIDMLGMSHTIRRVGEYGTVTSSCVRGLLRENNTYDAANYDEAPEVNVTFHGDASLRGDASKVLIANNGDFAPLFQLSWIKFIGMFYGMEEQANSIYNAIATSYRCAASNVNQLVVQKQYPQGAFVSSVQKNGSDFTVDQDVWWSVLASDAGVRSVNVTLDTSASVNVVPSDNDNAFAEQSYAIIDTTQYLYTEDMAAAQELERPDLDAWKEETGISGDLFAVKRQNIYLTDKSTNRNRRHSWRDRGRARPDLALRDLISVIAPEFDPEYTTSFLRNVNNPDDVLAQRRMSDTCATVEDARAALNLTECELPPGTGGYHASGTVIDAYGTQTEDIKSLALDNGSELSAGAKAGIAVGSIVGGLAVIGAGIWLWLQRRNSNKAAVAATSTSSNAEKGAVNVEKRSISDSDSDSQRS